MTCQVTFISKFKGLKQIGESLKKPGKERGSFEAF